MYFVHLSPISLPVRGYCDWNLQSDLPPISSIGQLADHGTRIAEIMGGSNQILRLQYLTAV